MNGGKTGGLNIKHHIGLPHKGLSLFVNHNVPQVIHQICLHAVDDLKEVLTVGIGSFVRRDYPLKRSDDPNVIYGRDFDDMPIELKTVTGEMGEITFRHGQ